LHGHIYIYNCYVWSDTIKPIFYSFFYNEDGSTYTINLCNRIKLQPDAAVKKFGISGPDGTGENSTKYKHFVQLCFHFFHRFANHLYLQEYHSPIYV
jgi:hypothetical protein